MSPGGARRRVRQGGGARAAASPGPRPAPGRRRSTRQASGGYARSIEPSPGPLGDPFGLRPVLQARGIEDSLTDQAVVVAGFTVQPDARLVLHPGGGIPNPRNAPVLGMRATVPY